MNTTHKRMLEARALRDILAANLAAAERGLEDAEIANETELFEKLSSATLPQRFFRVGPGEMALCDIKPSLKGSRVELVISSTLGIHLGIPIEELRNFAECLWIAVGVIERHEA